MMSLRQENQLVTLLEDYYYSYSNILDSSQQLALTVILNTIKENQRNLHVVPKKHARPDWIELDESDIPPMEITHDIADQNTEFGDWKGR